jgi:hypothetical protein
MKMKQLKMQTHQPLNFPLNDELSLELIREVHNE